MKTINFFGTCFLCVLLIFVSSELSANEHPLKRLTIAAPISDPFVYKGERGSPQGFLVELLALVEQKINLKVDISVMPWARGVHEVKIGRMDALMPTIYTDERAQFLTYPKLPIVEFNTLLLKRAQDNIIVDDITQLGTDITIVKIRAMSMGKAFDDAEKAGLIKVIEVRDFDHAIQMLATSRADLVACVDYISNSSLKRLNLRSKIDTLNFSNEKVPAYLVFSQAFAEKNDVNVLMREIDKVKSTKEYQALVEKYLK